MTNTRAAAWIGGGVLLIAWFAAAVGVPRHATVPARDPQPAPQATEQLTAIAADVHAQAERLRERLARAPVPQTPLRNPFAFDAPRPELPPPGMVAATTGPDPAPSAPAVPVLSLIGVAENATSDGPRRTAIIAGQADALYIVGEGQAVGSRYRVTAIGADAVELEDLLTGGRRRLALR
jgi:Tfp pilus assembly protein PilP